MRNYAQYMHMLTSCHLSLRAAALFTGDFPFRRRVGGSNTPVCETSEQKRAKALGRLGSPASSLLMRFPISGPYRAAWAEKVPRNLRTGRRKATLTGATIIAFSTIYNLCLACLCFHFSTVFLRFPRAAWWMRLVPL